MKTRKFLPIGILLCAMFVGGIACSTVARGADPGDPLIAESSGSSVSPTQYQYNELVEEAAAPNEPQSNLQEETECKDYFFKTKHAYGWVEKALEYPATVPESLLEEIINCEPLTLSDEDQWKNKLMERTRRLIYVARELDRKNYQYNELYREHEKEKARSEKMQEDAIAAFKDINVEQQSFALQMQSQQVDEEIRNAIVSVYIAFSMTRANYEEIFAVKLPLGASGEANGEETFAFIHEAQGTIVDTGRFGVKIVIAQHVFEDKAGRDLQGLGAKSIVMSIADPESPARPWILLTEPQKIPELDLLIFDAPISVRSRAVPLGEVNVLEKNLLVSHIYRDLTFNSVIAQQLRVGTWAMRSQLVQIQPIFRDTSEHIQGKALNFADDFMYVNSRVIPGDSGSILVIKDSGTKKIVGFIIAKSQINGMGIAVQAYKLREKLAELESQQRPHE